MPAVSLKPWREKRADDAIEEAQRVGGIGGRTLFRLRGSVVKVVKPVEEEGWRAKAARSDGEAATVQAGRQPIAPTATQ